MNNLDLKLQRLELLEQINEKTIDHNGLKDRMLDYGIFFVGGEVFERQRVGSNHMPQSVEKQIGALAAIKAELHLVQVGGRDASH